MLGNGWELLVFLRGDTQAHFPSDSAGMYRTWEFACQLALQTILTANASIQPFEKHSFK